MDFKTLKTIALISSAALGLMAGTASAAPDDDMAAGIETSSVITAAAGATMDFGDWLIGVPAAAPASTIVLNPNTGAVTPTPGAAVQLNELTSSTPAVGTVTVTLPIGADGVTLQMSRSAPDGTLPAGLALTNVSYYNPDEVTETGNMTVATLYPVTVDVGATGVAVQFGGEITATATPTDGTHAEQFNVAFAY